MMSKRVSITAAAALVFCVAALFGTVAAPTAAQADDKAPVILIVNQQALLLNSKAGQNIREQIAELSKTIEAEVSQEGVTIEKELKDLQAQKDLLSQEVLQTRYTELQRRGMEFERFRQIKVNELQLSERQALAKISNELQPILQKIVEDRGATILLDRTAVMYASADNDITQDVMAALNKKVTKIKVERVSLADQAAKQGAN